MFVWISIVILLFFLSVQVCNLLLSIPKNPSFFRVVLHVFGWLIELFVYRLTWCPVKMCISSDELNKTSAKLKHHSCCMGEGDLSASAAVCVALSWQRPMMNWRTRDVSASNEHTARSSTNNHDLCQSSTEHRRSRRTQDPTKPRLSGYTEITVTLGPWRLGSSL